MSHQTTQHVCQSCGMTLGSEESYGTNGAGKKIVDYCKYCYENGEFIQPNLTLDEMVEICVPFMVEDGMKEQAARTMMRNYLPQLKRWSEAKDHVVMQPARIVQKEEMHMVGIAARTSNAREMTGDGQIPQLWERFWQESLHQRIPGKLEPNTLYGCYTDYENGAAGEYTMLIGCRAESLNEIPDGMVSITIPAAKYAVFTSVRGPMAQVVVDAWQAIWKWSSASEVERTFSGDFELYDERSANPEDAQVDIYIAIK